MAILVILMLVGGMMLFFAGRAADDWVVETIGGTWLFIGLFSALVRFF